MHVGFGEVVTGLREQEQRAICKTGRVTEYGNAAGRAFGWFQRVACGKLASAREGSGGRAGDLRLEGEFRGGLGRPDEVSLG